ncbi:MAG: PP-loop domain-containing protein [Bryobacterales bacterium]|nr:PP-loop domain-containing protein [Bryobacterales bacterium]
MKCSLLGFWQVSPGFRKTLFNIHVLFQPLPFAPYNKTLDLEKTILRKVGEAIAKFDMIRDGDRIAVGVSGGKDSITLLETLLLLQKRAPIRFDVEAFTVEQGKFMSPIEPVGNHLRQNGISWHYVRDAASLQLLEDDPTHGCDQCSRFRRRAVYELARGLNCNVVALGHTADDFCESLLRNAMFTGKLSALPPVTYSRKGEFRLIRPLVFVTEDLTRRWVQDRCTPVIPCGCSQKTGTVRRSLRDYLAELEQEHPFVKETLISAMGNLDPERLLDPRFQGMGHSSPEVFPILTES